MHVRNSFLPLVNRNARFHEGLKILEVLLCLLLQGAADEETQDFMRICENACGSANLKFSDLLVRVHARLLWGDNRARTCMYP